MDGTTCMLFGAWRQSHVVENECTRKKPPTVDLNRKHHVNYQRAKIRSSSIKFRPPLPFPPAFELPSRCRLFKATTPVDQSVMARAWGLDDNSTSNDTSTSPPDG